jgi:hypothetical protein
MAQVNKQDALDIDDVKIDYAHEDGVVDRKPETEGAVLRSAIDDVSPWQAAKLYKRVLCISMLAAFSASLDGYRKSSPTATVSVAHVDWIEINLSGSIVSHRAFIQEMASDKALQAAAPAIDGAYVSAWGGMLVAGQIVGQICLQFATEAYGRKIALYILMTVLAIVSLNTKLHWVHSAELQTSSQSVSNVPPGTGVSGCLPNSFAELVSV